MRVYEVRPRKDHRGFDLISDALPFGRLWYDTRDNAIGYAIHSSRSHDAVIRVYDAAGTRNWASSESGEGPGIKDSREKKGGLITRCKRSAKVTETLLFEYDQKCGSPR